MRNSLVLILFLSGLQIAHAQTKEEQAVLKVFNKKFEWLINKQSDSLKAILDDRLMYFHSNGWMQLKQDVLDDLQSGKLIYKSVEVREVLVRIYSNAAIVTGKGKFIGSISENSFEVDLLFTEVYVLKNKKWILTSRQATRLP